MVIWSGLLAQNARYELPEELRLVPRIDKEAGGVLRRYAKDEKERLEVLAKMRAAEARAFHANQLANMNHTLSRGWIGGPLETAF